MGDIPASYLRLPRGYHFKVKKEKQAINKTVQQNGGVREDNMSLLCFQSELSPEGGPDDDQTSGFFRSPNNLWKDW